MNKTQFLEKVALTLEFSIKMADGWLQEVHPDNAEEIEKINSYRKELNELLEEISIYTVNSYERKDELEAYAIMEGISNEIRGP
jgi:hypothetical protein